MKGSSSRLGTVAHGVVVLALAQNPFVAAAYLTGATALVLLRERVPRVARAAYVPAAAALLAFVTLVVRDSPALRRFDVGITWPRTLVFLGVSYAFLRFVYALLAPDRWKPRELLRYFLFAPTFFSGPVTRPQDMERERQSDDLPMGLRRVLEGILRIGLAYLILPLVPFATEVPFRWAADHWDVWALWLGAFASGVWLYLEFSGYSEVFLGVARVCGIRAPENFDHPYGAQDLATFWRRWHISLGDWLRACVYNPLTRRMLRGDGSTTLLVSIAVPFMTMVACGVWHMVSPRFVLWGAMQGLGLVVHALWRRLVRPRLHPDRVASRTYRLAAWCATHGFMTLSWVWFLPAGGAVSTVRRAELLLRMTGLGS